MAMTFRERTLEEERAGSAKDGWCLALQRLSCCLLWDGHGHGASWGPGCDLLSGCSSSCLCYHHPPCQRLFKCYLKDLPLLPWGSEAEGLAPLTMGLQPGGLTEGLSQTPSRDSGSLG